MNTARKISEPSNQRSDGTLFCKVSDIFVTFLATEYNNKDFDLKLLVSFWPIILE